MAGRHARQDRASVQPLVPYLVCAVLRSSGMLCSIDLKPALTICSASDMRCTWHRWFRTYRPPGTWNVSTQSGMLFEMGTLEETKDQSWTWVLGCPLELVRKAGVEFDPDARGVKSIQGDATSGSALKVELSYLFTTLSVLCLCTYTHAHTCVTDSAELHLDLLPQ